MSEGTSFPTRGRLAGIDFGTARIGVAISDPDRILASPLETYERQSEEADVVYFQQLVRDERLVGWVIGLPVHMSGDESAKSVEARAFGAWLMAATELPVEFQDERYSTADADRALAEGGLRRKKAKARRDQLAAQAILARFLEAGESRRPTALDD